MLFLIYIELPLGPKEKERLQKIMEWAGCDFKVQGASLNTHGVGLFYSKQSMILKTLHKQESNIKLREKPRKLVKGSIEECEVLMGKSKTFFL